jgi:hypothetical protein
MIAGRMTTAGPPLAAPIGEPTNAGKASDARRASG